ncbi:MAG: hypothetical protein K2K94_06925 [Muribaculaceae bacterium]|nr:hypothetical protein [Muribaculaceae bacterium]
MKNKLIAALDIVKNATKNCFLFSNIWKERTTLLLHGVRQANKTRFALEMLPTIREQGHKAIYVDTQSRLDMYGELLATTPELQVLRPAYDSPDDKRDYADIVISAIEEVVAETDVKIFIIDSVTRIAALSFGRNASAAYVMKRLVALQARCGISLIVISHDSTKATDRALAGLADCEIALEIEKITGEPMISVRSEGGEYSVGSENHESSETSEASEQSEHLECSNLSKPAAQLSRRDRRLMRRQKQKSSR